RSIGLSVLLTICASGSPLVLLGQRTEVGTAGCCSSGNHQSPSNFLGTNTFPRNTPSLCSLLGTLLRLGHLLTQLLETLCYLTNLVIAHAEFHQPESQLPQEFFG